MKNLKFSIVLIATIIIFTILNALYLPGIANNLVFTTIYQNRSFEQNQDKLQSAINSQIQQTIANTNNSINNSNSYAVNINNDQSQNNTSLIPFQQSVVSINNVPFQKAKVGDIDIAYKTVGKGKPILLISGSGNVMDVWPSYFLQELSKDHQVIIFDNRGVGNTTSGFKPFSINQFANDTAGLLNALEIQKVDVLGFSMGSFVAQQLVLGHPEKVDRLILYGASCGGQEGIPQNPEVVKSLLDFVNNKTEDINTFLQVTFPLNWIKQNPNFLDTYPQTSEIILATTLKKQFEINEEWFSKDWSGVCDQLQNITNPTLIITGTEDIAVPSDNSLILVEKIPYSWLVQIKDAGHGLMYQFPETFTSIVKTFLKTTDSMS